MRIQQLGFYQVKFFLELIVLKLQLNHQRTVLVFRTHSDIRLQELHSAFIVLDQFFLLSFVNLGHVFNLPCLFVKLGLQLVYFWLELVLLFFQKFLGRRRGLKKLLFWWLVHFHVWIGFYAILHNADRFFLRIVKLYFLSVDFFQKFLQLNFLVGIEPIVNKKPICPIFHLFQCLIFEQLILRKLLIINLL